jgi:predicted GTPase
MRKVIVMGAGGRDFHNFNVAFRDDPETEVVAFTAAQIPGIDDRVYPPALAGPRYPNGIPVRPESELADLVRRHGVDEVVFAYSDVRHEDVMHHASIAIAAGADFRLMGSGSTMLSSTKSVVAVGAVRTGAGKSQTTRAVGRILLDAGLSVALVRHPMPYHDLASIAVQRFAILADIDASNPTIEAQEEADVVIWDGGNNDFAFYRPDLTIVVVDPLRPGHARRYHPGEANLRMADVVVVNKVDSATADQLHEALETVAELAPRATVIRAASPVVLEAGPPLAGSRVLVVEDGPTITHGGMPFGAGAVAARSAHATQVDPRPYAVGSIAETLARFPHIDKVVPAMGYSDEQLHDLQRTINAVDCDAVIAGTPIDLRRLVDSRHPIRSVTYSLQEQGEPRLADVLAPIIERARQQPRVR